MLTEKKRIIFIVNPISGTSSKKNFDAQVEKALDPQQFDYSVVRTEYAGHAAELAQRYAAEGVDICVAVGGDGTVNEVARALAGTDTALGIVPCGSGNGLARHLCLPMSIKRALAVIAQAQVDTFDYGVINGQPFFCTCGMGFDAFVSMKFAQSGKRGLATYARMVLAEGMRYKAQPYEVTLEGEDGQTIETDAYLVACANAAQYGNNTYIAPGASMQDGLLDVVIVQPFKGVGGPKMLLDLFARTLKSNKHCLSYHARRVHIHRQTEGPVHFDGDPTTMGTDIEVELVPRGLKAVVNPRQTEDHAKPNALMNALNRAVAPKRTKN